MRLFLISFLILGTGAVARAKDIEPATGIVVPRLISYKHLMALTPGKRQIYLNRIALAMTTLEAGVDKKINDPKEQSAIETVRKMLAAYLAVVPQASAGNNSDIETARNSQNWPRGTKMVVYLNGTWKVTYPNGKSMGPFPGDHNPPSTAGLKVTTVTESTRGTTTYTSRGISTLPTGATVHYYPDGSWGISGKGITSVRHGVADTAFPPPNRAALPDDVNVVINKGAPSGANSAGDAQYAKSLSVIKPGDTIHYFNDGSWEVVGGAKHGVADKAMPAPPVGMLPQGVTVMKETNMPSTTGNAVPGADYSKSLAAVKAGDTVTLNKDGSWGIVGGTQFSKNSIQMPAPPADALTKIGVTVIREGARHEDLKKLADKCDFSPATLDKARVEYKAASLQKGQCMAGGMIQKWKTDRAFTRGGCDAQKCILPGHEDEYQCSTILMCDDKGNPICKSNTQDFAKNCWNAAANKEQSDPNKLEVKKCNATANMSEKSWERQAADVQKFCGTKGADKLFCFECTKVKADFEDANVGAGADPSGAPAPPKKDDPNAVIETRND